MGERDVGKKSEADAGGREGTKDMEGIENKNDKED